MILSKKKLLKSLKKHEHHARDKRKGTEGTNHAYWAGREDALRTIRIKIKRGTHDE